MDMDLHYERFLNISNKIYNIQYMPNGRKEVHNYEQ